MGILGGADCADELIDVATIQIGAFVQEGNAGGIPSTRDESAGPKGGLGVGAAGNVEEDVGDYFGWEEDLAGGRFEQWLEGSRLMNSPP